MHKTNSLKFGHFTFEDRPLDDAELNAVTGGLPEFERGACLAHLASVPCIRM